MEDFTPALTTILIADDHQLLIDAVTQGLRNETDLTLRTAHSLAETLRALQEAPIDLVLLDIKMPGMNGMESVIEVIRAAKTGAVALFSGNIDEAFARLALREGAAGFVPKTLPMRVLPSAIRLMCSGEVFMPVTRRDASDPEEPEARPLVERELRILHMVQAGLTNKEIARQIESSEVRIKMYLRTIFAKIGAKNRAHAVSIVRAQGRI
jgi:DNA-binding NarL/FixJ family response regulator